MSNLQDRLQEAFPIHYRSGNILLINADCMEGMKYIKDKEINLACVDPPYGIGADKGTAIYNPSLKWKTPHNGNGNIILGDWDKDQPTEEYFIELVRVSKNQIIWGGNYFQLPPTSCYLIWDKQNDKSFFADAELAWTSFKTSVRIFRYMSWGFLGNSDKEKRFHPTQKPVNTNGC